MRARLLRAWTGKLFRVVRRGWADPLNTSFSRGAGNHRWNDAGFEALYCCGSERVARAVTLDVLRFAGVVAADLREDYRPQLIEIRWAGSLIDLYSAPGLAAAGFPEQYPEGMSKEQTRLAASGWHAAGEQGICCRSASLSRMGQRQWPEPAASGCEVALWAANWKTPPKLIRRRRDEDWLSP